MKMKMKMSEPEIFDFNQIFVSNKYVFTILGFGVSHSVLRILLVQSITQIRVVLECVHCARLVFPVDGGPVELRVSSDLNGLVTLSSTDSALTVLCGFVQWAHETTGDECKA